VIAAEVLREEFLHQQSTQDAVDATAELENVAEATVELYARFPGHVARSLATSVQSKPSRIAVLSAALADFTITHLHTQDIHSLAAGFDVVTRNSVLSSYYAAIAALEAAGVRDIPRGPVSALIAADDTELYALFGGQDTNEVYFDELQALYDIYTPYVAPFLTSISREVLAPLVAAH
jgi:fatty acid synthase subunit alpha, fungi type